MAFFWNKNKASSPKPALGASHDHTGHDHAGHDHTGHAHAAAARPAPPVKSAPLAQIPAQAQTPAPAQTSALANVRHVIAIASGKGGVGKSTVTTNLAVALKFAGATVGLLDADLYGPSQPGMLGERKKEGSTTPEGWLIPARKHGVNFISMGLLMPTDGPLVWRAPMAMKAVTQFLHQTQWGALDYLLIDLPPGTGDVQLTLAQQARLSGAVIVTTPQEVALGIAKKGLEMFRNLNIPILGIVENMSGFNCESCGHETAIFKKGGGERLALELGVPFLGALPLDPEIMQSGEDGVPVLEKSRDSHAAQAILAVATKIDQAIRHNPTEAAASAFEPAQFGLDASGHLRIDWKDSAHTDLSAFDLRVACGCASCVDENTGRPLLDPSRVPMNIAITSLSAVGRYALTAAFSDGHSTGIYPYKRLREKAGPEAPVTRAPHSATAPKAGPEASFQV